MEQVAAGIARDAKLRENNNRSAILNGKGSTADDFIRVIGGIGDLQGRANRCESVKSKHNLNID